MSIEAGTPIFDKTPSTAFGHRPATASVRRPAVTERACRLGCPFVALRDAVSPQPDLPDPRPGGSGFVEPPLTGPLVPEPFSPRAVSPLQVPEASRPVQRLV